MQTWTEKVNHGNGIVCYKGVINKDIDVINRIESVVKPLGAQEQFTWQPAYVGYQQLIPDYRDCVDFKYKKTDIEQNKTPDSIKLQELWQDLYDVKSPCVDDYRKEYNIMNLDYWEAFNFIKYGPGQHFQEHHDHGFSYNCTVSLVAYPNDDYEGGSLYFRLQDLDIKADAGDLFIFPSNFMYPHRAMPVISGTKYSIVTMLDYNKKFHTNEMYMADKD